MYGSHFFYSLKVQCVPDLLSNLPNNLLLAFNADGMHIFSVDKKELLQQYSYADVHSWRGTRRQVRLIWPMSHMFHGPCHMIVSSVPCPTVVLSPSCIIIIHVLVFQSEQCIGYFACYVLDLHAAWVCDVTFVVLSHPQLYFIFLFLFL